MVGSGFSAEELEEITAGLKARQTEGPPVPGLPRIKGINWVRPELRCIVTYQELTPRSHFRAPAFVRMAP
jgi:ATP-dependent DNA ligase